MSYFLGMIAVMVCCLIVGCFSAAALLSLIRSCYYSNRLSSNKKLYHWNGKGYYQRILK